MSFAIASPGGEHLGFVLLQGGPRSGDCLVRFLPKDAGQFAQPANRPLRGLMGHGEMSWRLSDGVVTGFLADGTIGFTIAAGIMAVGEAEFRAIALH